MRCAEVRRFFRFCVRCDRLYVTMAIRAFFLGARGHLHTLVIAMAFGAARLAERLALRACELSRRHVLTNRLVAIDTRQVAHLNEWKLVAGAAIGAERLMAFGNRTRIPLL